MTVKFVLGVVRADRRRRAQGLRRRRHAQRRRRWGIGAFIALGHVRPHHRHVEDGLRFERRRVLDQPRLQDQPVLGVQLRRRDRPQDHLSRQAPLVHHAARRNQDRHAVVPARRHRSRSTRPGRSRCRSTRRRSPRACRAQRDRSHRAAGASRCSSPGWPVPSATPSFLYTFNQLNGHARASASPILHCATTCRSSRSTRRSQSTSPSRCRTTRSIATSTYDGTRETRGAEGPGPHRPLRAAVGRGAPRAAFRSHRRASGPTSSPTRRRSSPSAGPRRSTLTFAWDIDSRADGKLAPKRLLMNSSAPYSFVTQRAAERRGGGRATIRTSRAAATRTRQSCPEAARARVRRDCRSARARRAANSSPARRLVELGPGTTPVVGAGDPASPGAHVAWIMPVRPRCAYSARPRHCSAPSISPDPARPTPSWRWPGTRSPACSYFEAYDGAELVGQQRADLRTAGIGATARCMALRDQPAASPGMTIRVEAGLAAVPLPGRPGRDDLHDGGRHRDRTHRLRHGRRPEAVPDATSSGARTGPARAAGLGRVGQARLAAESRLRDRRHLGHRDDRQGPGTRTLRLAEALYFRTKGLPGLNACPNVGDDIRLHVDTTYPARRATPLYRQEPCVLAFENSLSSVLPDRPDAGSRATRRRRRRCSRWN